MFGCSVRNVTCKSQIRFCRSPRGFSLQLCLTFRNCHAEDDVDLARDSFSVEAGRKRFDQVEVRTCRLFDSGGNCENSKKRGKKLRSVVNWSCKGRRGKSESNSGPNGVA